MKHAGIWLGALLGLGLAAAPAVAVEVNADGKMLIQEASEAWGKDMQGRPLVSDPAVTGYVQQVAERLLPAGRPLPAGVSLQVNVIDSPEPELFSYSDGHLVITTGMVYAMHNEAQLAAVLAHEVAHINEGYYIEMYQQIKAAERKQRRMAAAGALLSGLMDVAVDYAADYKGIEESEKLMRGEASYGETMKKMAAIEAARAGYYSMKDVVESIPPVDEGGVRIDPRLQFEPVADAEGMQYLALAGYDVNEAAKAWKAAAQLQNEQAKARERALGPMAQQMNQMQSMLEINMQRMRQTLGGSGLVQTIGVVPQARSEFVGKLTGMQEVRDAEAAHGADVAAAPYRAFMQKTLLPKADAALANAHYAEANRQYRQLYDAGIRTADVSYGLAKSSMGDFAFGASEAEKQKAEQLYHEANKQDPSFAPAYRGLGELYEDWERYGDAAQAYRSYLKLAPKAERPSIERKIKLLKRKAAR
ncbi:MAG TPA: M48 family metalloprotease [Mariprofundaceae bacterium]|nr:M48 family metalloprotease [Mariprofundaceae bacterium]